MNDSLGQATVLYALGLAVWAAASALVGRPRSPAFTLALVVLEVALVLQAIVDLAALGSGSDTPTNIGYLLTSLAVLPVIAGVVRLDPGRWGSAAFAMGCVLVIVVSLRLHQTAATVA